MIISGWRPVKGRCEEIDLSPDRSIAANGVLGRWYELAFSPSRRVDHCFIVLSYRTVDNDEIPDLEPISASMIEARRFDKSVVLSLLIK
jgi:hypothetical protein